MYNLTKLNVNTYNINPLNFLLVTNDLCYVCRSYTTLFSAVYLFVLMVSTSLYLFSFLWYWALILTLGAVYLTSTVGAHTPHSTQSVFWQTPGSLHLAHTASMSRKKEERVVVRWFHDRVEVQRELFTVYMQQIEAAPWQPQSHQFTPSVKWWSCFCRH